MNISRSLVNVIRCLMALCLVNLSACVGYETVDPSSNTDAYVELMIGDEVEVITASLEKHDFVITDISEVALIGEGVAILFTDIRIVEVRKTYKPETVGEVAALGAVAGAVILLSASGAMLIELIATASIQ